MFPHLSAGKHFKWGSRVYTFGLRFRIQDLGLIRKLPGFRICIATPIVTHIFFMNDSLFFFKVIEADMWKILQLLGMYGNASGQWINFDKCSISFSPNLWGDLKRRLLDLCNIPQVALKEKYLSLLTMVRRTKYQSFSSTKDRVQKRIQGWK